MKLAYVHAKIGVSNETMDYSVLKVKLLVFLKWLRTLPFKVRVFPLTSQAAENCVNFISNSKY